MTAQLPHVSAPADLTMLHRDAAYVALDLGESALAMTHAVQCLDVARSAGEPALEVKAHVTVALVMGEAYDDLGASSHFAEADALSRASGYVRGVALAAVNASHFELERGLYSAATLRLHALLTSEHAAGLLIVDERVGTELYQSFHINYVKGSSLALRQNEVPPGLRPGVEAQVQASAAVLGTMRRDEQLAPRWQPDILDSLTAYALLRRHTDEALALATERIHLARASGIRTHLGRALLERAGVHAERRAWAAVITDAQEAALLFEQDSRELLAVHAWQAVADARAQQGHFREAFGVQRQLTQRTEALYRAFFQQGAQLRQIERQAREAEVRAQAMAEAATHDPLTGAPNRSVALEALAALWEEAQRGRVSSVALMDIDHFKSVNDRFGHAIGDEVLIRVVQHLSAQLSDQECLARFGGEEFLLILQGLTLAEAQQVCEELRAALHTLTWDDLAPDLTVTGSFGVAIMQPGIPLKRTLQEADAALYAAKAAGRNLVQLADPFRLQGEGQAEGDEHPSVPRASEKTGP
ncbi:diguanylate cyclase [Deinococcus sp. HMF7620]|uniref:Diguanylate cyclase n=1 Tax=Deinococcus arboris TaxID=2682977 RepID=A0A7C9HPZ7_9DEIO|nr:GGDEF domain-containing protein [Deinococcus arboris]MVN85647.1 diguanylate cyclase [Deinococcus arboris]